MIIYETTTTHRKVDNTDKLLLAPLDFEQLDSGDCTSILKRLETLERKGADKKDLQMCIARIDSQLNYTLLF